VSPLYEGIRRGLEGEVRMRLAAGSGADDQAKVMLVAAQASSVAGAAGAAPETFEAGPAPPGRRLSLP